MSISLKEMTQVLNSIYKYLQKKNIKKICFEPSKEDSYFVILDINPPNTTSTNPRAYELGLGVISEDIEFLLRIIQDDDWLASSVSLAKLGAILRIIGGRKSKVDFIAGETCISMAELNTLFEIHMNYLDGWYGQNICFSKQEDVYVIVKDFNDPKTIDTPIEELTLEFGLLSQEIETLKRLLTDKNAKPNLEDFARVGIILSAVSDTMSRPPCKAN